MIENRKGNGKNEESIIYPQNNLLFRTKREGLAKTEKQQNTVDTNKKPVWRRVNFKTGGLTAMFSEKEAKLTGNIQKYGLIPQTVKTGEKINVTEVKSV